MLAIAMNVFSIVAVDGELNNNIEVNHLRFLPSIIFCIAGILIFVISLLYSHGCKPL